MDLQTFKASLDSPEPPANTGQYLEALWREAHGEWDRAHRIVQEMTDADAAWIHAYLHRREGDESNAGYWYRRAQRLHSDLPLDAEWEEIVRTLLER